MVARWGDGYDEVGNDSVRIKHLDGVYACDDSAQHSDDSPCPGAYRMQAEAVIAADGACGGRATAVIAQRESRFGFRPGSTLHAAARSDTPVVQKVIEYIEANYCAPISLRDVAQAVGYSPCHLTHVFREQTGTPITAWIIQRRIAAAQRLLGEANVKVAAAAEAVGFNDLCYFTRQFVRHVGMTPGRFRAVMNGVPTSAAESGVRLTISKVPTAKRRPEEMRELLLREPYSCTPVCRILIELEPLTSTIGPAGDSLCVPLRITGGTIKGVGSEKRILAGDDFAVMYADEKLMHDGRFVAEDPVGDVLVWYTGASLAGEGAYDDLLDGQLPAAATCRLSVIFVSTGTLWRSLTRRPLLGIGSFDGVAGRLEVTVLSVTETSARN